MSMCRIVGGVHHNDQLVVDYRLGFIQVESLPLMN